MNREQRHQWDIESFRSLAETGKLAQNALLLVGGGASAALLSFIGVLSGKEHSGKVVASLMTSLGWFYSALLLTVALSGVSYLAQAFYKAQAYAYSDMIVAAECGRVSDNEIAKAEAAKASKRGDIASSIVTGLFVVAFMCLLIGGFVALTAGVAATR